MLEDADRKLKKRLYTKVKNIFFGGRGVARQGGDLDSESLWQPLT